MGKRIVRNILLPLLTAVVLLFVVQCLLVSHMRLSEPLPFPCMKEKSHLWVNLTAYGLRLPGESVWGVRRIGHASPSKGDFVVFLSQKGERSAGICRALPGEVVWIDTERRIFLPARTSPDAQSIMVPVKERKMDITPYNARLFAHLLKAYEDCNAEADGQGHLSIGGSVLPQVRFPQDYYWVETRPGAYVFVPHSALVGKVLNDE